MGGVEPFPENMFQCPGCSPGAIQVKGVLNACKIKTCVCELGRTHKAVGDWRCCWCLQGWACRANEGDLPLDGWHMRRLVVRRNFLES
jgi:hypothetical protein